MPATRSAAVRYLCGFLLFALFFLIASCLMITLGTRPRGTRATEKEEALPRYPVIVIDAGHGGEDGGAIGEGNVLEKEINLKIAHLLNDMLRSAGYETVMTRTDDRLLYDRNADYRGRKKRLDLEARLAIAAAQENAVFVSIHMNAFPEKKYAGAQIYYSENHTKSAVLAEQLREDIQALLCPQNERQSKPSRGTSYLLDHVTHPAVLVECGFLSNPEECRKLASEEYQRQLATVLFRSLTNFCANLEENLPSP